MSESEKISSREQYLTVNSVYADNQFKISINKNEDNSENKPILDLVIFNELADSNEIILVKGDILDEEVLPTKKEANVLLSMLIMEYCGSGDVE